MDSTDVDTGRRDGGGDKELNVSQEKSQKQLEKEAKKKAKNDEKLAKFQAKQAKLKEKQQTAPAAPVNSLKIHVWRLLLFNIF